MEATEYLHIIAVYETLDKLPNDGGCLFFLFRRGSFDSIFHLQRPTSLQAIIS